MQQQAQLEMEHIVRWANVLSNDAYGILLDKCIKRRKVLNYYHSPYDCICPEDIDKMVIEIMHDLSTSN